MCRCLYPEDRTRNIGHIYQIDDVFLCFCVLNFPFFRFFVFSFAFFRFCFCFCFCFCFVFAWVPVARGK
ncbi:hypothetical protein DFH27DRAFT_576690 [Peziza echinospora]|nr:hypothetical protein DFH27DRAFT_576690 [Peziza echinospora]